MPANPSHVEIQVLVVNFVAFAIFHPGVRTGFVGIRQAKFGLDVMIKVSLGIIDRFAVFGPGIFLNGQHTSLLRALDVFVPLSCPATKAWGGLGDVRHHIIQFDLFTRAWRWWPVAGNQQKIFARRWVRWLRIGAVNILTELNILSTSGTASGSTQCVRSPAPLTPT